MTVNRERDVAAVADEILRYLRSHVSASDTAEGIAQWWLRRQRLEDSLVLVEAALERLVEAALVERRKGPAGAVRYLVPHGARAGQVSDNGDE
ncbi:MAG: hypothetical protein PVJ47_10485, partial [Thiohalocapsa sp.]